MERLQKKNDKDTHKTPTTALSHTHRFLNPQPHLPSHTCGRWKCHWLRQGIYLQSLALFRHNFQASIGKVGLVPWAKTTHPRRETVAHLRV